MPTYLFSYRAPQDYAPGSVDGADRWNAWFSGLGADAVRDIGNPIFRREIVGAGADTELGGYSLIAAETIEEAMRLAAGCPILEAGGAIEVGEITPLDPDGMQSTEADQARASTAA